MSPRIAMPIIHADQAELSHPGDSQESEKPFDALALTPNHEDQMDQSENVFVWAWKSLILIWWIDGDPRVMRTIPGSRPRRRDEA